MWNRYWVLCFTPFYYVLRDTRSATESGGFVVGYGMDKHEGMMTIGVWCILPCGGRATHSCSIHLACRARGTSMLESFLVFTITCAWRDAMQIWNFRFQILHVKVVNSTRGYFPDLIFTSAILQRRALRIASPSPLQIAQSVADYMKYAMTWDNSQPSHKGKSWSISKATSFYGISSLYLFSISSSSIFLTKLLSHMNTTSLFLLFSFLVSRCIYYIMPTQCESWFHIHQLYSS